MRNEMKFHKLISHMKKNDASSTMFHCPCWAGTLILRKVMIRVNGRGDQSTNLKNTL